MSTAEAPPQQPDSPVGQMMARTPGMLAALEELVMVESPSADIAATTACAAVVEGIGHELLGVRPERLEVEGRVHLRWRFGATPRVMLVGHFDTVWPLDTTARWPFAVADGRATGPGVFDMKAGIIQALFAIATLEQRDDVQLLLTCDEELGSITSKALIEDMARESTAALVFEPSRSGALKIARKGASFYHLSFEGVAAHASDPGLGANALVEMARLVTSLERLARPELGTTVTPTLASAGTAQNTVPAAAYCLVDVRARSVEEQARVEAGMRELAAGNGVRLTIGGGPNRPPMPAGTALELFAMARACASRLGIELAAEGAEVGGGSDGNFTAAAGTPTLDGLGAVGDLAHAEGEYVEVARMPERAALLAELVAHLAARG